LTEKEIQKSISKAKEIKIFKYKFYTLKNKYFSFVFYLRQKT